MSNSHVFIGATAALPRYDLDAVVDYLDHHGRLQTGKVLRIEATWAYSKGDEPLVVYTIKHPTARNRRQYVAARDIRGLSNLSREGEKP